ncbi:MAG: hypothetical protein JW909_07405 [Planctomycetes bacterium]|nr:hypothetical protein [Planctomycetota bacterium]
MQIYFCERCGKRVSDVEIQKRTAVAIDDLVYCHDCAAAEGILEEALKQQAAPKTQPISGRGRRTSHKTRAVQVEPGEELPMGTPGVPKWIYGAVVGGVVVAIIILFFVIQGGKEQGPPTAATPPTADAQPPVPTVVPDPAGPEPAQPEPEPAQPEPVAAPKVSLADVKPGGARQGAPADALLVSDFDSGVRIDTVPEPAAATIAAAPGETGKSLIIEKPEGYDSKYGMARILFDEEKNLSNYLRVGFYAAGGPVPAEVKVGVIAQGPIRSLITPDSGHSITIGPEWKWYELLLSGNVEQVRGLAFHFNSGGTKEPYKLFLDDVMAVAPKSETPAAPTASPATPGPAEGAGIVTAMDFENGLGNYESKYQHKVEASADAAHTGALGMKIIQAAGDRTAQASRVLVRFDKPVNKADFEGISFWTGGKNITDKRFEIDLLGENDDHKVMDFARYTADWKEHRYAFSKVERPLPDKITGVAFYFNKEEQEGPFEAYLDDIKFFGGKATAAASSGRTVFANDFEQDANGWDLGQRVQDAGTGSWVYESTQANGPYARRATVVIGLIRPRRTELFADTGNKTLTFDYYVSSGSPSPELTVTLWELKTNMNWHHKIQNVVKDRWTTVSLPVATSFETSPADSRMPADGAVSEIKIGLTSDPENAAMKLDNLKVTEAVAAATQEKSLFANDFEQDSNGWAGGERISDNAAPGSKWSYRAKPESENAAFSRRVNVASYQMTPRLDPLFTVADNSYVSLDYYVSGPLSNDEPMQVMFTGTGRPSNPRYTIMNPVADKWTKVDIPVTAFDKSFPTAAGDTVREMIVQAGKPGENNVLVIDNFRIYQKGAVADTAPTADATGTTTGQSSAVTEPVTKTGVSGGEAIVIFYADFEESSNGFENGARATDKTFSDSRGAFKATWNAQAEFFACSPGVSKWSIGKSKQDGAFQLQRDTKFTFAYYLEGADYIQVQFWNTQKNENFYIRQKAQQGAWTIWQMNFESAESNNHDGKKCESGDWVKSLSIFTGEKTKECSFYIDNVIAYSGDMPADMGKSLARKIAETKALSGTAIKDGFFLNGEVLANLAKHHKPDDTDDMYIAVLGDDLAKPSTLLTPLLRDGEPLEGHKQALRSTYASSKNIVEKLADKLERGIKRNKPEVMFIMAGYTDVRMQRKTEEINAQIKLMVEKCLLEGIVPILITLPRKPVQQDPLAGAFADLRSQEILLAEQLKIPLIEANKLLGGDDKVVKRHFSGETVRMDGYNTLNETIAKVYRAVEFKVFNRGEPLLPPQAVTGEETPAGPAEPGPEELTPEEQEKIDEKIDDIEI